MPAQALKAPMNTPLRPPARIVIRQNAARDDITIDTADGKQVFQMSQFASGQRRLAQEMLVDFWLTEHGRAPLYGGPLP